VTETPEIKNFAEDFEQKGINLKSSSTSFCCASKGILRTTSLAIDLSSESTVEKCFSLVACLDFPLSLLQEYELDLL